MDKGGNGQRGTTEIKEEAVEQNTADVTELIIGFCRDLAHSAFFFCRRAHLYLFSASSLPSPSFAANARVAFNPERLHAERSARCNDPLPSPDAHFSFYYRRFSRFDFSRFPSSFVRNTTASSSPAPQQIPSSSRGQRLVLDNIILNIFLANVYTVTPSERKRRIIFQRRGFFFMRV